MNNIEIRKENKDDINSIRGVVFAAFENHPHSNQTEHLLVEKLREEGALTVSLVAVMDAKVIGHIAFSPVRIDEKLFDWYGLAPVSVLPEFQQKGIGSALIRAGLAELHKLQARGCVLLGEPDYYGRFGFTARDGLVLPNVPSEYFLALPFAQEELRGVFAYHKAFEVCG